MIKQSHHEKTVVINAGGYYMNWSLICILVYSLDNTHYFVIFAFLKKFLDVKFCKFWIKLQILLNLPNSWVKIITCCSTQYLPQQRIALNKRNPRWLLSLTCNLILPLCNLNFNRFQVNFDTFREGSVYWTNNIVLRLKNSI